MPSQTTPETVPAAAISHGTSNRRTVRSLTSQQAIQRFNEHGHERFAQLPKKQVPHSLWEDSKTCPCARQSALEKVKPQEMAVIPGAFNSFSVFLDTFRSAAMIGLAPGSVDAVLEKEVHTPESLGRLVSSAAKRGGWQEDGFGAHVYRYVKGEMAAVTRQPQNKNSNQKQQQHHFFYVWNPETEWHPAFEKQQQKRPLGPQFGGYHHDLATLCLRMRSDRETLIRTTSYGRTALFHLLIPAYQATVVPHKIRFHEDLLPLTITGPHHDEYPVFPFVWLRIPNRPGQLSTSNIGRINLVLGIGSFAFSFIIPSAVLGFGLMTYGLGHLFHVPSCLLWLLLSFCRFTNMTICLITLLVWVLGKCFGRPTTTLGDALFLTPEA
ncbi:hypothetical protein PT974_08190 [Cladobotryum mycophilum]|uniref:Uncharacterized protein n=1 Tax=Cladobotryum mycophilum TaxID=491253 RepID=A0ABR0SDM4_9HYPO